MEITYQIVRDLFDYDPETGILTHRHRPNARENWNTRYAGKEVGYVDSLGYLLASVYKQRIRVHRLIFMWMTGEMPKMIDHIDGNGTNNRWSNLRAANHRINGQNTKLPKDNKTGVMGVRHGPRNGYIAEIAVDGKRKYLTYSKDFFEAVCARKSAEIRYGYHPNHGR